MPKILFEKKKEFFGGEIKIWYWSEEELISTCESIWQECVRLESKYSRFLSHSDLTLWNAKLNTWHSLDAESWMLISLAEKIRKEIAVFDITVGSVLESWGYDREYSFEEKPLLSGEVQLDSSNQSFRASCSIDLGGMVKGYALERMKKLLENSTADFLINASGDIYISGDNNGSLWHIGLENPLDTTQIIGECLLHGQKALTASSIGRRSWKDKHHIVHPLSEKPGDTFIAAFVQGDSPMLCDMLSTCFIAGNEKTAEILIEKYDIECLLINTDQKVFQTAGFQGTLFS